MMRRPAELREIERVRRLAELVQHVVARVDDVVDRARADRLESLDEPVGARTDLHAANHDAHEAAHEIRLGDAHGDGRRRAPSPVRVDDARNRSPTALRSPAARTASRVTAAISRAMPRCDSRSGRFAPTSITSRVSPSGSALEKRRARRNVDVELQMPSCSSPSPSSRAEQSMPSEIAPRIFRFCDLEAARQRRCRSCANGYSLPAVHVRRAAHDVEQRARARVDLGDVQVIGVRMRRFLDDARDDDRREVLRAARRARRPSRRAR